MSYRTRPATQNIDVRFFCNREGDWTARIQLGVKEKPMKIGPANMEAVCANLYTLLRQEAMYTKICIHTAEEQDDNN